MDYDIKDLIYDRVVFLNYYSQIIDLLVSKGLIILIIQFDIIQLLQYNFHLIIIFLINHIKNFVSKLY